MFQGIMAGVERFDITILIMIGQNMQMMKKKMGVLTVWALS